ncbi:NAD-dependent epimerase/dehydratase family protein [Halobaculum limi]|uniref:NAD-dependent epimerase/dehydratase family protein n=1 Tax=Halobaculum limi TaxID=3031916 RepID=UPI002405E896|nr:NAD-dependent epimerase/dehydratase family protein [Halobaculum sp. YSMS11]
MDILVTGGAGFIGGHLAEAFVVDGHNVTVIDNLKPFYDIGLKQHTIEQCQSAANEHTGSYEFIQGDIRNADLVGELVEEMDAVVHQAAQAGVRASVENPREVTATNVDGTVNLLQSSVEADVERVLIASSSSVYGKAQYLPYDEDHPTEPVSPYGVSKLATEELARVYSELHSLSTVCLRYFTVYGPRMRPNMAISNFVSRCMNGEAPVIYGSGKQTRDFTHVSDVVKANQTLLEADVVGGDILNIGSTDTISIEKLATLIRDELAPELDLRYEAEQEADAAHTHADVSKAREAIGYDPSIGIELGVTEFIQWYRSNRDWYEPLVRNS